MVLNCISPGDFMASIDLKDAYFSVPIFQPHRKYLRFLWNFKRYEFTCLPLGTAFHPGFSLRFLSLLWLILGFLASGLIFH